MDIFKFETRLEMHYTGEFAVETQDRMINRTGNRTVITVIITDRIGLRISKTSSTDTFHIPKGMNLTK